MQEQVRALTERLCGEESEVCAFFRGSRRLLLLLRGETEEAVRETGYEFCQNLRHELCQVLGWNALCAIGAPVSRVSALPESYRTAKDTLLQASACAEAGVFGSTDFAGVQHEFDFSAGGSLADKLRHAAPEDVPRIVEGYFGGSAAQDVQSVRYRYYLLMNLLVTASQLAHEVQAGSIPPPEDPQAVLGQAATLEGTKACAAEVLGRMTRVIVIRMCATARRSAVQRSLSAKIMRTAVFRCTWWRQRSGSARIISPPCSHRRPDRPLSSI